MQQSHGLFAIAKLLVQNCGVLVLLMCYPTAHSSYICNMKMPWQYRVRPFSHAH